MLHALDNHWYKLNKWITIQFTYIIIIIIVIIMYYFRLNFPALLAHQGEGNKKENTYKNGDTLYTGFILCFVLPGDDPEGSKLVGGSNM